jgi:hypothetical protein
MSADKTKVMNKGDLALRGGLDDDEGYDREQVINAEMFPRNVYRGDVVKTKVPSESFAHFWHREDDSEFCEDEYDKLMEGGWREVTDKEFTVRRWKKTTDGRIKSGRFILFYLPEADYNEREKERLRRLGVELDRHTEGFHATAEEVGVGTWETRGGRTVEKVKGRSSTTLLDEAA